MKQVYDKYYQIKGCRKNDMQCTQQCTDNCENTPVDFCYEAADCNDCIIERTGLAEAYVPYQTDLELMDGAESLKLGTVFKMLVKPYERGLD